MGTGVLNRSSMKRFFGRVRRVFPLRAGAFALLAAAGALVFLFAPKEADF